MSIGFAERVDVILALKAQDLTRDIRQWGCDVVEKAFDVGTEIWRSNEKQILAWGNTVSEACHGGRTANAIRRPGWYKTFDAEGKNENNDGDDSRLQKCRGPPPKHQLNKVFFAQGARLLRV